MHAMTGAPYETMIKYDGVNQYSNNYMSFEEQWADIKNAIDKGYAVGVGTPGTSDANVGEYGLAESHAYQVLKYYELPNGEFLLRLRNPWKSEQYNLAYSDTHTWTDAEKAAVGDDYINNTNDGMFFIPLSVLDEGTDSYFITYVEFDWKVNQIEHVDDSNGSAYHSFIIDNPVKQTVFIQVEIVSERSTYCV